MCVGIYDDPYSTLFLYLTLRSRGEVGGAGTLCPISYMPVIFQQGQKRGSKATEPRRGGGGGGGRGMSPSHDILGRFLKIFVSKQHFCVHEELISKKGLDPLSVKIELLISQHYSAYVLPLESI